MVERLGQLPGIRSAAITYVTPMTGTQLTTMFQPVNELASAAPEHRLAYNDVGPGYFRTMETRILRGREFERDEQNRNVCVLNEYASRTLFPNQQAIGSFVRTGVKSEPSKDLGQVSCRVIGIAEDAKYGNLRDGPPNTIYFPITKERATDNMVFLINANHKIDAVQAYRKAVREIAPKLPVVIFATLQEQMDAALGSERLIGLLSSCFGVVALFLSAIGLYGLLSSNVAQRTGEIGVRIALGATRVSVIRMILQEALRLQGVGVLLGLLAFAASVQFISRMLYGVSAFDPASLILTVVVLTAVTLAASIIPALRAASVDPIQALRAE